MSHKSLRQITIHGIPWDLYRDWQKEARKKGMSLKRLLFKKFVPFKKTSHRTCADLLRLAGSWDEERMRDFEEQIGSHRRIDPELWS